MIRSPGAGELLRQWRQRRHLSQLALASEAEISQRHLSFVESGRSVPSRDMIARLAERLAIPLRERNAIFLAAGFAPLHRQRSLDHPDLAAARRAIDQVLAGHEPYPALAVDRHWTLISANAAAMRMVAAASPALLQPPINVLRLSLHPDGLAGRIINLDEWRGHVLARLRHQIDASSDANLIALHDELAALPGRAAPARARGHDEADFVVKLRLTFGGEELAFFTTITVFGTPVEVTLSELAIEALFPADEATAAAMRRLAGA